MELVYPAATLGALGLFRALGLRLCVEGDAHVPATGPVVLAGTHVSFLDFALLGLAARRNRRRLRFLARDDLWQAPWVGPVLAGALDRMGHVPVDRAAPAAAYLRARSLLRGGEALGIFPEAGISTSYTVRSLMPGAVALARETGAPILPVAIWGPQRLLTAHRQADLTRGRPVGLLVGTPLLVPPGQDVTAGTVLLGERLQELLEELQRRPEHRPAPGERAPWHPAHLGGQATHPRVALAGADLPGSAVPSAGQRWGYPGGRDDEPAEVA